MCSSLGSTRVLKLGGDPHFLFLEVLPRLTLGGHRSFPRYLPFSRASKGAGIS